MTSNFTITINASNAIEAELSTLTDVFLERCIDTLSNIAAITYWYGQLERGDRLHFQGCIQLSSNRYANTCKQIAKKMNSFSLSPWIKEMRGEWKQATHYASKPHEGCNCQHCEDERRKPTKIKGPFEGGQYIEVERKMTLHDAHKLIKGGCKPKDLHEKMPTLCMQYAKMLPHWFTMFSPNVWTGKRTVELYWGVTHSGKSYQARKYFTEKNIDYYTLNPTDNTLWWSGYDQQEGAIINEFTGQIKIQTMLAILDEGESTLDVGAGGGKMKSNLKHIIITSNLPPIKWYPHASNEEYAALMRRFNKVIEFTEKYNN